MAFCLLALPSLGHGQDEEAARYSASLETWVYGSATRLSDGGLLNPGNRLARIPGSQTLLDARLNLRAEAGPFDVLLTPRLLAQSEMAGDQTDAAAASSVNRTVGTVQATQAFARLKLEGATVIAGRELLTWGPATFRSPSNPFYFDAGKTNPLAALSGVDLVRSTYALGSARITGAYVFETSQLSPPQDKARTAVLKVDQQGADYLVSLIAAKRPGAPHFIGGFAQFAPSDAWLVYGEFGTSNDAATSMSASTATVPAPSGRTQLAGASYTLDSGQVLASEWLHNAGGFTRAQQDQYFAQALTGNALLSTSPQRGYGLIGQTLAQAPRLMGRDYLWLSWQSNPQESALFWRTEWSQNLSDRSAQAMVYVEKNFAPKLSGFVVASRAVGGVQTDYGQLVRSRITVGLKWFVF
jgi:hypothetical protein